MGNNSLLSSPMLVDWKPHPHFPHIFLNTKNNKQVQQTSLVIQEREEEFLGKRMSEIHSYITKVQYYQIIQSYKGNWGRPNELKCLIFTDAVYPLHPEHWVPTDSSLLILKGFRRLSNTFGYFKICEEMIRMNEKHQVKLWVHPNPALGRAWQTIPQEQIMLADITRILMKYDPEIGSILSGCQSINSAINLILMKLPEAKIQSTMSTRSYAQIFQQDRKKNSQKNQQNTKNNIRSTKQTEDDFPKPALDLEQFNENLGKRGYKGRCNFFNNLQIKEIKEKTQPSSHENENKKNLIFAQKTIKPGSPEPQKSPLMGEKEVKVKIATSYLQSSNHQNNSNNENNKYYLNVNKNFIQSQNLTNNLSQTKSNQNLKSGKDNNTIKKSHLNNLLEPCSTRNNAKTKYPNSQTFMSHYLSPIANNNNSYKNIKYFVNKSPQFNRKSDLNRQILEESQEYRPSDLNSSKYTKNLFESNHEKSKNHLQKQSSSTLSFLRTKTKELKKYDNQCETKIGENKIWKNQQERKNKFQDNQNGIKKSNIPSRTRIITEKVPTNKPFFEFENKNQQKYFKNNIKEEPKIPNNNNQHQLLLKPGFREEPKSNPSTMQKMRQPVTSLTNSPSQSISHTYEEKKAIKQKLSKKLRAQLGGVMDEGFLQNNHNNNIEDGKDKQIKKKVQEKKKNFAQLKNQAMKLLID